MVSLLASSCLLELASPEQIEKRDSLPSILVLLYGVTWRDEEKKSSQVRAALAVFFIFFILKQLYSVVAQLCL
ncbi:hypothetical protein F0562_028517 [Nyssa sinensis]|uniref:Uncharacterized protein n=1 Tax=Nyssa sinensis TaxID=561372 RepID=A0A5J5B063_9ASTE|nr:hypothetical protein F0562_028517 [Nyssa sinensis]